MATSGSGATSGTSSSSAAAIVQNSIQPIAVDCSKSLSNVWLVKVPKYLAQKWNEAPENVQVGRIVITQTQMRGYPKPKQEVVFQLNESLGQTVNMKVNKLTIEEKIPLEHKFMMTPIENQNVYILSQQAEESSKESLSIVGKVVQRAECRPVQNDSNYYNLKREAMKKFTEPVRQIKIADDRIQRTKFLPVKTNNQIDRRDKNIKKLRGDKNKVQDMLFQAFTEHQYYNIKDLEKKTGQPTNYLKEILHKICNYHAKGLHKNTWELKEEYRQHNSKIDSKKTDSSADKKGQVENMDDEDDEDDEDFEDFEDDDDDDDDAMIGQM